MRLMGRSTVCFDAGSGFSRNGGGESKEGELVVGPLGSSPGEGVLGPNQQGKGRRHSP